MSHLFVEFNDFEYIKENVAISDKVVKTVYVKVLDDNQNYLGSLKFGLYNDHEGEKLKNCISDIICQNYPKFNSYESEISKIK